jgi:hypothetical protein
MTTTDQGFRSQAEAIRDARVFIWGDVPFAQRKFVGKDSEFMAYVGMLPNIVVSADVNGHLFVIRFDHYGRVTEKKVIR